MSNPTDPQPGASARTTKLIAEITRTPNRVAEIFEDLSHWERIWRPHAEAWNCAEIAGHLLDNEIAVGYRIRTALAEPGKSLDAFEQNAWVTTQGHGEVPVEETLASFAALRRNLIFLVARLSEEQLGRHYFHSERGRQTILDTLVFLQTHDTRHQVQLGHVAELARHARPIG